MLRWDRRDCDSAAPRRTAPKVSPDEGNIVFLVSLAEGHLLRPSAKKVYSIDPGLAFAVSVDRAVIPVVPTWAWMLGV